MKTLVLYVLTYISGGIVLAVDDKFTYSPRHSGSKWGNGLHPN
jgi:hypothetical protein